MVNKGGKLSGIGPIALVITIITIGLMVGIGQYVSTSVLDSIPASSQTDVKAVSDHSNPLVISMQYTLDETTSVEVYNSSTPEWVTVPSANYTLGSSSVTIDAYALDANSSEGRINYKYIPETIGNIKTQTAAAFNLVIVMMIVLAAVAILSVVVYLKYIAQ